jgi:hypothetical protein
MNSVTVNYLKNWFASYVARFYTNNPEYDRPIRVKEEHTKRVCENIVTVGEDIGISNEDMVTAEIIALLHDVGRFRQYQLYHTFVDAVSVNHAKMGMKQIGINGLLSEFPKNKKIQISKAVIYHNASRLPANEDEKALFFMKLIRDADKLDIWKVFLDYYTENRPNDAIVLGLPDKPYFSQKVVESIRMRKSADMKDLKTLNDFKLLQISWVFDINFIPSFRAIKKNNFMDMIEGTLPKVSEITGAVKIAHDYVNSKLR